MLFTIEGLDCSGKSTQCKRVQDRLAHQGVDAIVLREPGGTNLGTRVRNAVVETDEHIHPPAELLCMLAARVQSYHEILRPALDAGKVVLADRYVDTSVAYQGGGRELGMDYVHDLCWETLRDHVEHPTHTFLLDITVPTMRSRMFARDEGLDRFEREGDAFFERIRRTYLAIAEGNAHNHTVLDEHTSIDTITATITDYITLSVDARNHAQGRTEDTVSHTDTCISRR